MLTRFLVDPLCPPELQVLDELRVWNSINNVLRCSEGWWWFDELGNSSAFLLHLFEGSSVFLPLFPQLFPLLLMARLWFGTRKNFLVPAGWFVTVVILQWFPNANSEVLGPSGASDLLFWESSCVSSISLEELHAHCWAVCSFPCFWTVHFYKDPFASWAKFSSYSTLLNVGKLPWSWPSFYPGLEQSPHQWAGCAVWARIASVLSAAWQMGYSKWI